MGEKGIFGVNLCGQEAKNELTMNFFFVYTKIKKFIRKVEEKGSV